MVAPDVRVLDLGDGYAGLEGELGIGPVLIQAGHRAEVLLRDVGGISRADEGVGVGWVAHDQNLAVLLPVGVQSLALARGRKTNNKRELCSRTNLKRVTFEMGKILNIQFKDVAAKHHFLTINNC